METQKLNFTNRLLNIFDTNELKNNRISENDEKSVQRIAIEKFTQMGLPTVKNEEWKYTNLGFLNRGDFKINFDNNLNSLDFNVLQEKIKPVLFTNSNHITFINGVYSEKLSDLSNLENGITITNLSIENKDSTINYFNDLQTSYKLENKEEVIKDNPFELLFDAFPTNDLLIEVKKNTNEKIHIFRNDFGKFVVG